MACVHHHRLPAFHYPSYECLGGKKDVIRFYIVFTKNNYKTENIHEKYSTDFAIIFYIKPGNFNNVSFIIKTLFIQ